MVKLRSSNRSRDGAVSRLSVAAFEENFKQKRLNHIPLLNRRGSNPDRPHYLRVREEMIPRELVSNLAKDFRQAKSLRAMLLASINEMACS
jgi:hypothetical protein